jgi:glutamate---cysteine ligase / carboxylate-amine ligase
LIDLELARQKFEGSTDGTVGLEEEFAILDPVSLDLVSRFEELRDAATADPVLSDAIAGELIASEIEIRSGRGVTFGAAVSSQRDLRRRLFALGADRGAALGATGTHPWADYRDQRIIDTEHYRRLNDELRYVVWRNNTFSLHVHVGVRGADRAVRTADRLRPVLPLLLAVSANSPYLDGQDSGLHSARTATFTRVFPRCGIPEAFGDWATFAGYIDFLQRTRSIVEFTQVWWSVRPHVSFGTVEVRICDAQSTAAESEALAGLVTAACCRPRATRTRAGGAPTCRGRWSRRTCGAPCATGWTGGCWTWTGPRSTRRPRWSSAWPSGPRRCAPSSASRSPRWSPMAPSASAG